MNDMVILGVAASAKSLAEQNATAIEALKGGMKYKGAVEDYAHLPATGNKAGDVWSTLDDGCEYVWGNVGGTNQWIQLGTAGSEPLTDAEVDAAVGAELITVSVTNGTATGDTAIAGTATVTIVPNEGYILPQSVTVANASYTYDSTTGVISLSNATDTVTISAICGYVSVFAGQRNIPCYLVRKVNPSTYTTWYYNGSVPSAGTLLNSYAAGNDTLYESLYGIAIATSTTRKAFDIYNAELPNTVLSFNNTGSTVVKLNGTVTVKNRTAGTSAVLNFSNGWIPTNRDELLAVTEGDIITLEMNATVSAPE